MSQLDENLSLEDVFTRFTTFEKKHSLFGRRVSGIPYWHMIRARVYAVAVVPHFMDMGPLHPDYNRTPSKAPRSLVGGIGRVVRRLLGRIKRRAVVLWQGVFHAPSFASRRRDVLISLTPRLVDGPSGRPVRQMVDYFVGELRSSYATCEWFFRGAAARRHFGAGRVFGWAGVDAKVSAFRASAEFGAIREAAQAEAEDLAGRLNGELGTEIGVEWLAKSITDALSYAKAAPPALGRWLKRLKVKCVVTVVSYCFKNFVLTKTAREMGIPVVELQHGTIFPTHIAYNLPLRDSPYSPDWLFVWGRYWARQTANYPVKRAVVCGYPYVDAALVANPLVPHETPTVLFISQGPVGRRLSEAAVALRGMLSPHECRIVFKPHPNEMRTWRSLYPELAASGVEVVDSPSRTLYSCLAESDAIAGVYSTAMIEGFSWGAKAFVFKNMYGAEMMSGFCKEGLAEFVDGPAELADKLRTFFAAPVKERCRFDREELFAKNAAGNVAAAIDRIVGGLEP